MTEINIIYIIVSTLFSLFSGLVMYIIKRILNRMDKLEKKIHEESMSEDQVRRLMDDRFNPLKERLVLIERKLDHFVEVIVQRLKS